MDSRYEYRRSVEEIDFSDNFLITCTDSDKNLRIIT